MREVKIRDRIFNVRGLTRGEVKGLRADGFNLMHLTVDTLDDAYDRVCDLVFDTETIKLIDGQK